MCRFRVRTGVVRRCAGRGPGRLDLLLPLVRDAALDGGWAHWIAPGAPTLVHRLQLLPGPRPLLELGRARSSAPRCRRSPAPGSRRSSARGGGGARPEDMRLPLVISGGARGWPRQRRRPSRAVPRPQRSTRCEADIEHLEQLGITRFYVYRPFDISSADWAALRDSLHGVQLFAQTTLDRPRSRGPISTASTRTTSSSAARTPSTGSARRRTSSSLLCLPSVGPGYDAMRATGDKRIKPRRDGKTYDSMWRAAIHSKPDGVTITSYNEWHEGTQIEPARATPPGNAAKLSYESYDGAYGLARQGRGARVPRPDALLGACVRAVRTPRSAWVGQRCLTGKSRASGCTIWRVWAARAPEMAIFSGQPSSSRRRRRRRSRRRARSARRARRRRGANGGRGRRLLPATPRGRARPPPRRSR